MRLIELSVALAVLSVTFVPQDVTASTNGGLITRVDIADGTELRILPLVSTLEALPSIRSNHEIFSQKQHALWTRHTSSEKYN